MTGSGFTLSARCSQWHSCLRFSIVVDPGSVVISRKWFGIPYSKHSGIGIEDVFYGGDYGDAEGATGVNVVLEGGREFHIGCSRLMHELYDALAALKGHRDGVAAVDTGG